MNIITSRIDYRVGDDIHQARLAYDDSDSARRPGVILVHEWWGVNEYIAGRTRQLAELGYVALAIDMYGNGRTAQTPDEAGGLMNGVLDDMEAGTAALRAGHQLLLEQDSVDVEKTAAIWLLLRWRDGVAYGAYWDAIERCGKFPWRAGIVSPG